MTDLETLPKEVTTLRNDALHSIHLLTGVIELTTTTSRAKVIPAHAIAHLAHTTADLTKLRRELHHPGATK